MTQTKSEFMQWCDELEAEGYHILYAEAQCPTELQGFLPGGEVFYFRARGSVAKLEVGFDNPDASKWSEVFEEVIWNIEVEDLTGDDFLYSWLKVEDAQAIFLAFIREYRQTGIEIGGLVKPTQERLEMLKRMLMTDLVS